MTGHVLGRNELADLNESLADRDVEIVRDVAELRLMTARQIEAIHFSGETHESPAASSRAARRVLQRLTRDRLLIRLERRVGGVRAGSGSFIYALGPVGHRALAREEPRPRYREPTVAFIDHTLAITQLVVDLIQTARTADKGKSAFEILEYQPEPRCWRQFTSNLGPTVLRPDLFVSLGVQEFDHRWFVEVDRGTEHMPAIIRKCRAYESYYAGGIEQAEHGVFPRVCWLVPTSKRADKLRSAIKADRQLTNQLFVVTTPDDVLTALIGGQP